MVKIVLVTIVLVLISGLLLAFGLLMRDNKRYGKTEVGHNKHMREMGISCTKCDEFKHFKELKNKKHINPKKLKLIVE